MKKHIGIIIVVVVLVVILIAGFSTYNGFVDKEEEINAARSAISVQLQRRSDLIPNFVSTVKGYSDYEKETYTAVTEARAKVGSASGVSEQAAASEELDRAISVWVNAVTEAYPELKANTQYIALQDELAGTENRVAVARKDYNDKVKVYNASIRKFPKNIIAKICGFERYELFENSAESANVPKVEF